jgi:hypothetical protein
MGEKLLGGWVYGWVGSINKWIVNKWVGWMDE